VDIKTNSRVDNAIIERKTCQGCSDLANPVVENPELVSSTQANLANNGRARRGFLSGILATLGAVLTLPVLAEQLRGPIADRKWWPTKWGASDQAGASNYMTAQKVLEATQLIQQGQVYSLGRVYESGMPFFPGRGFSLRIPGNPTLGPVGDNKLIAHEEFLATEIGQVGSQFDGLPHIGIEMDGPDNNAEKRFYNGMSLTEIRGAYGFKKLGVENAKPFVCPAVLFDVKAVKGRNLERGEEIRLADLISCLEKQNMSVSDFGIGDVALIRTGWGDQWMVDNKSYYDGEPGIGLEATQWLIDRGASMIAADNWAVEVLPNPDADLSYPVHQLSLTKHGVYLFENLVFDDLAANSIYKGAFFFSPVPIKGATGSPGNPIVIA